MSKHRILFVALSALVSACSNGPASTPSSETQTPATETPDETVAAAAAAPVIEAKSTAEEVPAVQPKAQPGVASAAGKIAETMDAGGYTYVRIKTATGEAWAAGPVAPLEVGQHVELVGAFPMKDFRSAALDRTFDTILFCSAINPVGASQAVEDSAPVATEEQQSTGDSVALAEGGQTIEQVITSKDDFVGKTITIRARVTKFSPAIMKKNWIHIQDGTGSEGTNELTITTDALAAVGDIVVVKGVLVADKDFGYGYFYDLIVEDAEVTIE